MRRTGADPGVQSEQELVGRAVGAVDGEAPAEPIGLAADFGTMSRNAGDVIRAPVLGAPGSDPAAALGLDELDAAPIWESLFGGIDDLNYVAVSAAAGKLGDGVAHLARCV